MAMATTRQGWRSLSPAGRLLVCNGLAFNLGFYMMMPYLSRHLTGTLEMAGWASGLVMGMRVFSQQGLFLLGGSIGDRLGYRRAILWGCLIRSAGFALLGCATHFAFLVLAAFLTGFAGALFTPCAQAYLASECSDAEQRQQAFGLHNLASEAGMLLGPPIGMLLTNVSYITTGLASAALFLLITVLQWRALPVDRALPNAGRQDIGRQWVEIARNRPFLQFTLLAAAYQLLFHQIYLAVPTYVQSQGFGTGLLGAAFTLSAIVGVSLQLPANELVRRLGIAPAMGLGLTLMGCSYLALAWLANWPIASTLAQAAMLSLGSILCFPLFAAYLPHYSTTGRLGGYYGFYASVGGCFALLGNILIGALLGDAHSSPSTRIWYSLAVFGCLAGWFLYRQISAEGNVAKQVS